LNKSRVRQTHVSVQFFPSLLRNQKGWEAITGPFEGAIK